jgi:hypothetical protein
MLVTDTPVDVSQMPAPIRELYESGNFTTERALIVCEGLIYTKIEFAKWLIAQGTLTDHPPSLIRRYARRKRNLL